MGCVVCYWVGGGFCFGGVWYGVFEVDYYCVWG